MYKSSLTVLAFLSISFGLTNEPVEGEVFFQEVIEAYGATPSVCDNYILEQVSGHAVCGFAENVDSHTVLNKIIAHHLEIGYNILSYGQEWHEGYLNVWVIMVHPSSGEEYLIEQVHNHSMQSSALIVSTSYCPSC